MKIVLVDVDLASPYDAEQEILDALDHVSDCINILGVFDINDNESVCEAIDECIGERVYLKRILSDDEVAWIAKRGLFLASDMLFFKQRVFDEIESHLQGTGIAHCDSLRIHVSGRNND